MEKFGINEGERPSHGTNKNMMDLLLFGTEANVTNLVCNSDLATLVFFLINCLCSLYSSIYVFHVG